MLLATLLLAASVTDSTTYEAAFSCMSDVEAVRAIRPGVELSLIRSEWKVLPSDDAPVEAWQWPGLSQEIQSVEGYVVDSPDAITHFWTMTSTTTISTVVHHLRNTVFSDVTKKALNCLGEPDVRSSDGQLFWIAKTWPLLVRIRTPRKPVVIFAWPAWPDGELPIFLDEGPVLLLRPRHEGARFVGFEIVRVVVPDGIPQSKFADGDWIPTTESNLEKDYVQLSTARSREVIVQRNARKVFIWLNARPLRRWE